MRFIPQLGQFREDAPPETRRKFGRLPQETLMSNIGLVLDISAGGMCVICRWVPRGRVRVILYGYRMPEVLVAEVTWRKRVGFFKYEVGLCFHNVSADMSQRLTAIAGCNRQRRMI